MIVKFVKQCAVVQLIVPIKFVKITPREDARNALICTAAVLQAEPTITVNVKSPEYKYKTNKKI